MPSTPLPRMPKEQPRTRSRWRRTRHLVLLTFCALLLALAIAPLRNAGLRALGHVLTVEDPLERADVLVISVDADGAGVLEASDLFHRGVAPRIAVFSDPPDAIDQEFQRRGVAYFDAAATSIQQLHALGIQDVERIRAPVSGTNDEAHVLPDWSPTAGAHAIVIICTRDHARRVRRQLRRAMHEHPVTVIVHPSRYSEFNPDDWWHTREGTRIFIVELEKLLLDLLAHPLS